MIHKEFRKCFLQKLGNMGGQFGQSQRVTAASEYRPAAGKTALFRNHLLISGQITVLQIRFLLWKMSPVYQYVSHTAVAGKRRNDVC